MMSQNDNALVRVLVEVSDDAMQAWFRLADPDDPEPLSVDEIAAALKNARVAVTDAARARCQEVLDTLESVEDRAQRFCVAEGRAPVEGTDGEFKWHESFEHQANDWLDDAPADYYSFNSIITVEKDMALGTVTPAVPGKNGVDVRDNVLRPAKPGADVQLDPTVRLADDGTSTVMANVAGKVVYQDGCLSISEVFEVAGDVDYECGNIDSSVDVAIRGTVLDNFEVHSKKSIKVRGAIQAASIEAGEDVLVRGGILGRKKGTVRAGGQIVAKFAEDADLQAKGDIKLTKEMMNSHLHADGFLLAPNGSLIGGDTYARQGAEARALGSGACIITKIAVGIHPDVVRQAEEISEKLKAKRQAVERIREGVKPLMANLKRLTPAQKERATELLFQADAMDTEINETEEGREKMLQEAKATEAPFVTVSKLIYPGVRIRIGRRHVVFENEYKGPVRIEKRKIKGVTEFVAANQLSGSISVLPSSYVVEVNEEATGQSEQGPEAEQEACGTEHGSSS
jgi:hypothetical protein